MRTVGVEEEMLLVDPHSGRPVPGIDEVRERAALRGETVPEHELKLEQAEIASGAFVEIEQIRADLRERRDALISAAAESGLAVAAVGTSPLPLDPVGTPDERYDEMAERFGLLADRQLTCGMHVHVSVDSPDEGAAVIDRIRPWLAVLVALSANSPYWQGVDSGHASYRTIVWSQWPTAGPTGPFGDAAGYHAAVADLLASGTILDEGMIYFDARLSRHYPTVEIRVADVCTDIADATLVAALARAMVDTAARQARDGIAAPSVRTELLRVSAWQAARFGLDGDLVDVIGGRGVRARPASEVLARLLDTVSASLRRNGDLDVVTDRLTALQSSGGGASGQRRAGAAGDLTATVLDAARRTA